VHWCNHEHRHRGIRFVTPTERHDGADTATLAKRHTLNEAARRRNPSRWSGKTRHWAPIESVALNPALEPEITPLKLAA